jgi:hypothetical protein
MVFAGQWIRHNDYAGWNALCPMVCAGCGLCCPDVRLQNQKALKIGFQIRTLPEFRLNGRKMAQELQRQPCFVPSMNFGGSSFRGFASETRNWFDQSELHGERMR